jgi:orotate phosphoribosyltransferase
MLADKVRNVGCDAVISPALGGIVVGQEVGRALGKRHIFAEKAAGGLVLRRGFKIVPNEKFIVAEDVVTRGGRVQETIDIVREKGGIVAAVAVIVDRSGGNRPDFGCPLVSLIEMNVETFDADNLPPDLAQTPAIKPEAKSLMKPALRILLGLVGLIAVFFGVRQMMTRGGDCLRKLLRITCRRLERPSPLPMAPGPIAFLRAGRTSPASNRVLPCSSPRRKAATSPIW